jgi:hypothetical protein
MYIRDQKFVFTPLHEITQGAGAVDPAQAERERQLQRYLPKLLALIYCIDSFVR